jgi:hypothetical protein
MTPAKKPRPPQTPAQQRASNENWARLQLASMESRSELLVHQGFLTRLEADLIQHQIYAAVCRIVDKQRLRMQPLEP